MSEQRKPAAATAAIPAKPAAAPQGVNPFDALDTPTAGKTPQAANPFDALDPERTSMMDAFWHGMAHGAVSTLQGTGQLAAHLGRSLGLVGDKFVERSDAEAEQYQGVYEQQHEVQVHPWAAKAGEVAGNMASSAPLMLLPGMGPATVLGRLASGTALGTVEGILQPVTDAKEEDFYTQKAWQGLMGAGGGTVGAVGGEVAGTVLSRFIARGDQGGTVSMFRRLGGRARGGVTEDAVLSRADQRILTAVDQIIVDKGNLRLTNAAGHSVVGETPASLRQFDDALDQQMRSVFAKSDAMMQRAGQVAPPIDLVPIAQAVRASATKTGTRVLDPGVVKRANALAARLEKQGGVSLAEAQDMVQEINQRTQEFWRNVTKGAKSGKAASMEAIEADVATRLRASLDKAVTQLEGPGYQELRNTYGALKAVRQNITQAVIKNEAKRPGGVGSYLAGIMEAAHILGGVFTLHPAALLRGVSIAGGKAWMKRANDPNRMVQTMFDYRSKVLRQNTSKLLQAVRDAEPVARRRITQLSGASGGAQTARQDTLTMVEP